MNLVIRKLFSPLSAASLVLSMLLVLSGGVYAQTVVDSVNVVQDEETLAVGDSLQFTLDIGHARINSEGGVEEGFRVLGDNIHHIHFTDNYGKEDDHLPIGDGNIDYSSFFHLIRNFPHIVTLEVFAPGPDPSPILKSLAYFRKLEKTMGSSSHS